MRPTPIQPIFGAFFDITKLPLKTLPRHPGRAGRLAGLDTIRQRETVAHACRPGGPDPDAAHACGTG